MRVPIHLYEYSVPGNERYIKTVEAEITHLFEDARLCVQGTAIVDGQSLPVVGGRSSGAKTWKHFKYVPVERP